MGRKWFLERAKKKQNYNPGDLVVIFFFTLKRESGGALYAP